MDHRKITICVSGAADMGHCGIDAPEDARALGRAVAEAGAVIVTGATTGFPLWAARGAKEAGGISIGFSPASSEKEHLEVYKLPIEYMDLIVYTGFGYPGRDLLLTRASDAVIIGCGRIGTIHEFTIAYEDGKPLGILEGDWHTDEVLKTIMANSNRTNPNIVFNSDPKAMISDIVRRVRERREAHPDAAYLNTDDLPAKMPVEEAIL